MKTIRIILSEGNLVYTKETNMSEFKQIKVNASLFCYDNKADFDFRYKKTENGIYLLNFKIIGTSITSWESSIWVFDRKNSPWLSQLEGIKVSYGKYE